MNDNYDLLLNTLYKRQITTREQLLNEMLRVKLTQRHLADHPQIAKDKEKLFQLMKKTTEDELGFFPADRDDFIDIYHHLHDVDLLAFTLEIYKNDRLGTIMAPEYLTLYIAEKIKQANPCRILITEAEKHLAGLKNLLTSCPEAEFVLTTQLKPMQLLLELACREQQNVKIRFESIYTDCLLDQKFDYIYTLPVFGSKPEEISRPFLTRDSDGIALENMLEHLSDHATLSIIVPAKITFAALGHEKLRAYIAGNYSVKSIYILPEGTFRPVTSIKTYLFTLTAQPQPVVAIGTLTLNKNQLAPADQKVLPTPKFLSHEDWRIELLLADDDENIRRFKSSSRTKVKLKEVAEVFRGKSILKKDTAPGSIAVLNIANIENGEIDYTALDTLDEEERKIKRYELLDDDVLLSCRGTAMKTAVFRPQDKTIIASANLVVIRPTDIVLGEYIKIFLESPVGTAMIKSFQRGTAIMNINHADIMEMEIPLVPVKEQQAIINQYYEELNIYKAAVTQAEQRWAHTRSQLYRRLI